MRALPMLLLAAASTTASADDTWLRGFGTPAQLHLTSGTSFPAPQRAIEAVRIAAAMLYRATGKPLRLVVDQELASSTLLKLPSFDGLALATLVLEPRTLELEANDVARYLEELDAPEDVRERWQRTGSWRERSTRHAHAIIQSVGSGKPAVLTAAVGKGLQIVPTSDPSGLTTGGLLGLCIFQDGEPVAGQRLGIVYANTDATPWQTSGADGCATFILEATGATLARTTVLRESSEPGLDWQSDVATLTFATLHQTAVPASP